MNGHEEEPDSLSWREAWARERIHVSPQGGSEACSGKVICTAGVEQDLEFQAAASQLSGSLRGLCHNSVSNEQR